MAFDKRQLVAAGRLAALAGLFTLRGPRRYASWLAHDFLWLYPTLRRNCGWHGEICTRFEASEREVWLTIDDGPDERDTPGILDQLARHNAKATFFVVGRKVEQHRDLCRRILAEGHSLGNHTYSHPAAAWWALPRPLVRREISLGADAIRVATGSDPVFFRSPVGMNNFSIHPVVAQYRQRLVGWSAAGKDGCPLPPSAIVNRIMSGVKPGAIILLHESGPSRHRVLTAARLLDRLAEEGFRCVLPSDLSLR